MSNADKGRSYEYKVAKHLTDAGWLQVMRAAASKGPADLLMAHPIFGAALVQVGSKSKRLGPADRARLVGAATLCNALAILAVVVPYEPIRYWLVTPDTPSKWDEWTP